jgi:hypothetical protein
MTVLTSVTEIEDRIVDALREIQRPVVDYVRKGVEQAEGRLPKLSYPKGLPTPSEVVESQFEFAKALFDTQRTFVSELVDAVSPLVEADEADDVDRADAKVTAEPATPAPATAAPRPAAKARSKAKGTPKTPKA